MYKNIFFLLFLVVFSFFIHTTASAGINDLLKLQSNDPLKILMAWAQKIMGIFPEQGTTNIVDQIIAFLEDQVQLRKSIFWIEFEKEKIELYADTIRLLNKLGINNFLNKD